MVGVSFGGACLQRVTPHTRLRRRLNADIHPATKRLRRGSGRLLKFQTEAGYTPKTMQTSQPRPTLPSPTGTPHPNCGLNLWGGGLLGS